jgi:hypothetical protein
MQATRERFARIVEDKGGRAVVAKALGCTPAYVGLLISGDGNKRPGLDMARAIEAHLGIPMQAWAEAPANVDTAAPAASPARASDDAA